MNKSKQAFWVMIGTASTFFFSILSSIILSRYLNKVDYGSYKQVIYIYNSLSMVFILGLPKAYSFFLPRISDHQQRSTIKKISLILFLSGTVMSLCMYLGSSIIADMLRNQSLVPLLKTFSVIPMLMLPTLGIEGILATLKKAHLIALYNFLSRIILLAGVTIPIIYFNGTIDDVIVGFVVGSVVSFTLALSFQYFPFIKYKNEKTTLTYRELFNYSIPIFIAGFWGVVINSSDQFFISRFYGAKAFAEFSNGWIELPFVTMVVAATSVVLSPIYSKKAFVNDKCKSRDEIIELWHSVLSKTIRITYPLILFCLIFAKEIIVILFGDEYEASAVFFQIKIISAFFILIAYGPLVLSIGGNKYYLKTHFYGAVILIGLQTLVVFTLDSAVAIAWASVICLIGRVAAMMSFVAGYLMLDWYRLIPWGIILKVIPSALLIYAIKCLVLHLALEPLSTLIIAMISYILLFFLWAKAIGLDYKSIIIPLINKV